MWLIRFIFIVGVLLTLNPIEIFAAYYCVDDLRLPVPKHHREMYADMYNGGSRQLYIAPRFYAKSTVCGKFYPLYEICKGKAEFITLISETSALAVNRLGEIKRELEYNPAIRADFGEMKTDKWTENEIVCHNRRDNRRIRIMAKGKGSQVRGFHPDIVIFDDLENDEEVRSDDQRQKLEDWFWGAAIPMLPNEGRAIVVGTKLHPLSLLAKLEYNAAWSCRKYQALQPDGTALWPELHTVEKLRAIKAELGERKFNAEYQNDPIITENPIFVKSWFKPYDLNSPEFKREVAKGLYSVVALDPAASEKQTADYTGIVCLSATLDQPTKIYIRKVLRDRWLVGTAVNKLVNVYKDYQCRKAIFESVGFQKVIGEFIRAYERDHYQSVDYVEVKPDRDKVTRAEVIAPMVQHGLVYYDPNDVQSQRLVDECSMLPTGDFDDLCDAFVYAMTYLKQWLSGKQTSAKAKIVLPGKRNPITGVVA